VSVSSSDNLAVLSQRDADLPDTRVSDNEKFDRPCAELCKEIRLLGILVSSPNSVRAKSDPTLSQLSIVNRI
jgi:hypothetical protein